VTLFYYKCKNISGEEIQGIYEAESEAVVASMIKQKGFYPIKINVRANNNIIENIRRLFFRVEKKDLAVFCRHFAVMIESGIMIIESLEILERQTENKRLRSAVGRMIHDIKRGMTITDAFRNHPELFPEIFVHMIEAGELTGNLGTVLNKLALHYEKSARHSEKIKNAMIYPVVLSLVALVVVIFLVTNVIPVFACLFEEAGADLPIVTKIMLMIGQRYKIILMTLLLAFVVTIIAVNLYGATQTGSYNIDKKKLVIPIFGRLQIKMLSADFCRLLSILVSSGIPLLQAIKVAGRTLNNQVFRKELDEAREGLRHGKGFAEVMNPKVFPVMMIKMIAVGEETGNLEYMLDKAAAIFEGEVELAEETLLAIIEPAMIIIMSLVIGFIVLSVVLPMFSIYNFY
jgi:type IV pilus assembly protein PilC